MKKLSLIISIMFVALTLTNCATNPAHIYERNIVSITEKDVIPANVINSKYLCCNNLEQAKYVMMHIVKYKMKFPQVDYNIIKKELKKLEVEGETYQIRLMASLTKEYLNDTIKIKNIDHYIKISNTKLFFANIYDEINKSKSKSLAYEG